MRSQKIGISHSIAFSLLGLLTATSIVLPANPKEVGRDLFAIECPEKTSVKINEYLTKARGKSRWYSAPVYKAERSRIYFIKMSLDNPDKTFEYKLSISNQDFSEEASKGPAIRIQVFEKDFQN